MNTVNFKQAIDSNNFEQVKIALESGTDVNTHFESGFPDIPLLYACDHLYPKPVAGQIVELLIGAGASLSSTDKFDHDAMYHAVRKGNIFIVKVLKHYEQTISSSCSLLEFMSFRPRQPLLGQREGLQEVLKLLLDEKPYLELKTDDNNPKTALHIACKNGFQHEIEMLLMAGSDPNCKDYNNEAPLAYIANYAWRAHSECIFPIYMLVKCGADIDNLGNSSDSETALGWATMYGGNTLTVVAHLLEHGAEPNKENNIGETPLIHASRSDRADLVQILLFFGAKLDHKDKKGKAALDYAIERKRDDVVNLLSSYK